MYVLDALAGALQSWYAWKSKMASFLSPLSYAFDMLMINELKVQSSVLISGLSRSFSQERI